MVNADATLIGLRRDQIDTPALLLDLDALERNIRRMADFFSGRPAHLRPHSKTHKTPQIARLQIAAGAPGVTCAKVGEAEALVAGGVTDLLIANEIVGATKIARLMSLCRQARITVAVDDPTNVAALSQAAQDYGVTLGILVEVNVGMNRCGVEPGEPALALAREVLAAPGLEFRGLMGYEGHCVAIPEREKREAECRKAMTMLVDTARFLESSGVPVAEVSGGGTGTYDISGQFPGVTEIQAGSYATMDASYQKLGLGFECALTVLTSVISRPTRDRAVCDAGMKAITNEFGLPVVKDLPDVKLARLSEEHGRLELQEASDLRVGDKIELIPSHGCTTINLNDRFYGLRDGRVEVVWPIAARGRTA